MSSAAAMRIVILGAGAGGGLPQWNCGCRNCRAARSGQLAPMSQSAIAVSVDGRDWAVINASPDIRGQLAATPALHPTSPRHSPLQAVLITNGDIDHIAGLLTLREAQPFALMATETILGIIAANPVFDALAPAVVRRQAVPLDAPFALLPGLEARLIAVPGKVPLYLEGGGAVATDLVAETTVGVELTAGGRRALYIPGCAALPDWLLARIEGADLLAFDGTLWRDDEMIRAGLGQKTGQRMGHLPAETSIAALKDRQIGQRVFVHINNSNPLCDPATPESAIAAAAGWQIGRDGMEIAL